MEMNALRFEKQDETAQDRVPEALMGLPAGFKRLQPSEGGRNGAQVVTS